MNPDKPEFPYSIVAVVLITAGYVVMSLHQRTIPAPGGLEGHLVGSVGFLLMIMTETLYSLRKRSRRAARWGSMQSWLRFHIFTGIVGPYMVLLHTSWRFNGLAGIVTLLTLVVVLSGFIGRYIYTVVPRSTVGVELESGDMETQIQTAEAKLRDWMRANPLLASTLPASVMSLPRLPYNTWPVVFGRVFIEWGYRWRWWRAKYNLRGFSRQQLRALGDLLIQRRQLHYQIAGLAFVRRVLALWHTIHVPLGVALFTLAFFHIAAALYYLTFAR